MGSRQLFVEEVWSSRDTEAMPTNDEDLLDAGKWMEQVSDTVRDDSDREPSQIELTLQATIQRLLSPERCYEQSKNVPLVGLPAAQLA